MNATSAFKKVITLTAGTAVVALAGSGCTAVTAGVAMPDQNAIDSMATAAATDSLTCADVGAQKVEIPAMSAAEPQLRIPQPEGWESSTEFGPGEEMLRFTMVNPESSVAGGPQDAVVVAVEEVPDAETEAIFDEGRAALVEEFENMGLPTDVTMTSGTVCGLPAQTYASEGRAAGMGAAAGGEAPPTSVLQVVSQTCGRTYLVVVLAIGADDTPSYQRDAEAILTGFEVLPATNASI